MPDDEKIIDVGEANEIETEIDLDAPPAPEQSLEEEKIDVEQVTEDSTQPADAPEKSDERKDVQEGEQKKELDDYSEGVNKRIAKLTRRMREAERQKEAALDFAKGVPSSKAKLVKTLINLKFSMSFSILKTPLSK